MLFRAQTGPAFNSAIGEGNASSRDRQLLTACLLTPSSSAISAVPRRSISDGGLDMITYGLYRSFVHNEMIRCLRCKRWSNQRNYGGKALTYPSACHSQRYRAMNATV